MNSISFKFPERSVIKSLEQKNSSNNNTISKTQNKDNYSKICNNVYKFDNVEINPNTDEILLFKQGVQLRKEQKHLESIKVFEKYLYNYKDMNNIDNIYETYVNLALLHSEVGSNIEIIEENYNNASFYYPDRAEPYFYLGLYCNRHKLFQKAYETLNKAYEMSYEDIKYKYPTADKHTYGKYVLDELSVTCFWLKLYDESIEKINLIIDDPDFTNKREHLQRNLDLSLDAKHNNL